MLSHSVKMTLLILASILTSSGSIPPSTGTFPQQPGGLLYFLVFIAIIVTLRLYRGIHGRRYSNARVLRLPVIYTILTLVSVLLAGFIDNEILVTLALIPLGFIVAYRFGSNVNFFTRNGTVFYRRSPVIMVIWLASFISRYILEILYGNNLQVILFVDAILSLTTGLIIGEAFHVLSKRKDYIPQASDSESVSHDFSIKM